MEPESKILEISEILKILGLINNIEENINQEFIMKKIYEIRNYLIEEINQNKLVGRKHKKVCRVLNCIDPSLIVISKITECVSIFDFASLVGIPIGIASSTIGLKICVITAGIKKYKSIIKKKKKSELNSIEVLISKALIDSNISYNEFVLINNVLNEFYDIKEEIKNSNNKV